MKERSRKTRQSDSGLRKLGKGRKDAEFTEMRGQKTAEFTE